MTSIRLNLDFEEKYKKRKKVINPQTPVVIIIILLPFYFRKVCEGGGSSRRDHHNLSFESFSLLQYAPIFLPRTRYTPLSLSLSLSLSLPPCLLPGTIQKLQALNPVIKLKALRTINKEPHHHPLFYFTEFSIKENKH